MGYPQLSAILECADAAHGLGGHVISDGGCACPGDFSKAFGGGADFVMAGGKYFIFWINFLGPFFLVVALNKLELYHLLFNSNMQLIRHVCFAR